MVAMTQQPMRDRKNVLGQCLGDEVKNFGKYLMETQSTEYGFICHWSKCKELTGLKACYLVLIVSGDSLPYWQ